MLWPEEKLLCIRTEKFSFHLWHRVTMSCGSLLEFELGHRSERSRRYQVLSSALGRT